MKNTTLVMGILAVLATLSGCGIGDAGSVGVGVGSDDGLPLASSAAVTEYAGQQLGLIQHTGVLPADRTVTFALLSSPAREQFITITMRDTEVLAADYGTGDPFDAQTERIALDLADVSVKPDGVLVAMPSDIASAFGESTIALLSSDTVTSQCTQ